MSEKRKYRPIKQNAPQVKWFGFQLTETAAQLLFLGSIIAILLCLIWAMGVLFNFVFLLSAYSAIEESAGMSGFAAVYGTILVDYIITLVVIFIIIALAVYTLNRAKQYKQRG